MAKADPSIPVKKQILDMINAKYNVNLTVDDVEFGQVTLVGSEPAYDPSPSEQPFNHNSRVEIRNSDGQPYEFTTTLAFSRLSLAVLFENLDKKFIGEITHTHQLIPLLRERTGLPITEDDIDGHEIEGTVGYPKTVLLNAAFNSLLLFGSVTVTLAGP